jgi:hypothetical protein
VIGAVPFVVLTNIVPLLTIEQEAAVNVAVAETPVPALIIYVIVPVHPDTSLIVTVCEPWGKPVKVIAGGVVDDTNGPPSKENVYGPVPLLGVTVMVPLATEEQVAFVVVPTPVIPAPSYT